LNLSGQDYIPFQLNGKWGYKDSLDNVEIEPKYQFARKFHEKYAVIAQNDQLGAIDKANNQIIYPEYEFLKYIGNERFIFGYKAKYFGEYNLGIITSKNEIVIPAEYYNIESKNDYFIVNKQSYKTTNSDGIYNTREITNRYGIIDTLGNIILKPIYSRVKFLDNGYIIISKKLNGDYALLDNGFNQLTEFKYFSFGEFHDGLINARKEDNCGYLNLEGEEEIEFKYETTSIFIDSLATVRNNSKVGLINRNDEKIIDFKYQALGKPYKNQIIAYDSSKWGMINLQGDTLLNFEYDKRISEFKGITVFSKSEKWKVWNYKKEILLLEEYDEINLIEGDESYVLGFGRIKPKKYSQSIAFVRINDKWGIINEYGEILIPINFERIELFKKLKTL